MVVPVCVTSSIRLSEFQSLDSTNFATMDSSQEEVVYGNDATETTHEGSTGGQDVSADDTVEYR